VIIGRFRLPPDGENSLAKSQNVRKHSSASSTGYLQHKWEFATDRCVTSAGYVRTSRDVDRFNASRVLVPD